VAKVLKDGYREKVKVATKLPGWLIKTRADMDKYLDEQLARLETDTIDFYLIHSLNAYLWKNVKEAGVTDFLDKAIKDGRIRYAGFSFHDENKCFNEIIDAYDWSFCQIQYNYMDENFQAGKQGLLYAAGKGMGVIVMEPLRGGKLAAGIPEAVKDAFNQADIKRSPADWALRWVWDHKGVSVVLSGMNTMEQLEENLKIAGEAKENSLSTKEKDVIGKARDLFLQRIKVPCTACAYCMPCPNGIDIPSCFRLYNDYHIYGRDENYRMLSDGKKASNCIECGECESHCPQFIAISRELKNVTSLFEGK